MAAPTYGTDLTTVTTADAAGAYAEWTATGWIDYTTAVAPDPDNYIQGTATTSFQLTKASVGGAAANAGTTITLPTDGAWLIWGYHAFPAVLQPFVSGGIRVCAGNSLSAFYAWVVDGADTYQYGGWKNYALNPSIGSPAYTAGTPTGAYQYVGMAHSQAAAPSRGQTAFYDALRYGRCILSMTNGDLANGYATLSGAAAFNDLIDNRYGLLSRVAGGYQFKGLLLLGSGSLPVDFRDANSNIVIENTLRVTPDFNTIEVRNTASRVDMTAISFQALGTASRGRWITTDDADINLTNCTFTDMATFKFQSVSTLNGVIFRRCDTVTQSGSTLDGCVFDQSFASMSLISDNPSLLTNCTFNSDGDNHAIQIVRSGSFNLTGHRYSGYVAGAGGTASVTSSNATIYNTSGGAVTCSVFSGDTPSVRNSGTSTTNIITGQVNFTLNGMYSGTEVRIFSGSGSGATELAGVEDVGTAGTFTYTYTYTTPITASVAIFHLSYLPQFNTYILAGSDQTIPIQQTVDRQYLNPA
jgi:hypothetical protein